jgi:transposase
MDGFIANCPCGRRQDKMQLQTILNRVQRHKSFVYKKASLVEQTKGPTIEVEIQPRGNSRAICSGCGRAGPGYDREQQARRFEHVPLWGMAVIWLYVMRRVNCQHCGVKVECVPWAEGKHHQTTAYQCFLASWAKLLSWKQVARSFRTTWDTVFRSVKTVVAWGLAHRSLEGITAIGVDEVQWQKGHKYLTLVYQIDQGCKRLLWIGKNRTAKTFLGFFRMLGTDRSADIRFVCSDMWKAFLKVVKKKATGAIHILDRFHIMAMLNKAIDKVRAAEAKRLKQDGLQPVLKHSRWCWLKRVWNLTTNQAVKLKELLKYNLQTVRAYLLKEDFHRFWEYRSAAWAKRFLKSWCTRVLRSKLEPMKKVARTLRNHEPLILNWFRAKGTMSSGVVEGLNYNVKLTMRKAYGFRTYEAAETALYHRLGQLPEPELTHRFC